jgi:sulfur carrier protein
MRAQGKAAYLPLSLLVPPIFETIAMRIVYNGTETEILNATTLLSHLQNEGIAEQKGIAVAVNDSVIPRAAWADTLLNPEDTILVIKATQGG